MRNEQLSNILVPSCKNLHQKITFFSLFEDWTSSQNTIVKDLQKIIVKDYHDLYYHTLFHLMTCHFCTSRAQHILHNKIHPLLFDLSQKPRGQFFHDFVLEKQQTHRCLKAHYFCLFWEKLPIKKQLMVQFPHQDHLQTLQVNAAGSSNKFPNRISIPIVQEEIYLCFEDNAISNSLDMFLVGGSPQIRTKIVLKLCLLSGEVLTLSGEDIAIGGVWSIPQQQAHQICLMEFIYN